MAVQVSTTDYEFSHGRKPRGSGAWAFFFDADPEPFWHTGSYADAKKMAVAWAVTKGCTLVRVGS